MSRIRSILLPLAAIVAFVLVLGAPFRW